MPGAVWRRIEGPGGSQHRQRTDLSAAGMLPLAPDKRDTFRVKFEVTPKEMQ